MRGYRYSVRAVWNASSFSACQRAGSKTACGLYHLQLRRKGFLLSTCRAMEDMAQSRSSKNARSGLETNCLSGLCMTGALQALRALWKAISFSACQRDGSKMVCGRSPFGEKRQFLFPSTPRKVHDTAEEKF